MRPSPPLDPSGDRAARGWWWWWVGRQAGKSAGAGEGGRKTSKVDLIIAFFFYLHFLGFFFLLSFTLRPNGSLHGRHHSHSARVARFPTDRTVMSVTWPAHTPDTCAGTHASVQARPRKPGGSGRQQEPSGQQPPLYRALPSRHKSRLFCSKVLYLLHSTPSDLVLALMGMTLTTHGSTGVFITVYMAA